MRHLGNGGIRRMAFWQGKRVLITGHTGFKGAWLTLFLEQLGAKLSGVSLPVSDDQYLWRNIEKGSSVESNYFDLRDEIATRKLFQSFQPEIVFHLAAQSLVAKGVTEPIETLSNNILSTATLLNEVQSVDSVRSIVVVTTDKVYANSGSATAKGFDEGAALGGDEFYGVSKVACEHVVAAFKHTYSQNQKIGEIGVATARAGNVLGGGDWGPRRLVPDFLRAFDTKSPLLLRNPFGVRPWQHVFDVLAGYLLLAQNLFTEPLKFTQSWNFANPTIECNVSELISKFNYGLSIRGKRPVEVRETYDFLTHFEPNYLRIDATKSHQELGWASYYGLNSLIDSILDWHLEIDYLSSRAREISESLVHQYLLILANSDLNESIN